jgi:hypothetical protein
MAHGCAVRVASQNGHLEIVKLLMKDSRVDPSALENRGFRAAAQYGHIEVVRELLKDSR